jgi:signal-transduction protein with cAMP-binding, CBS, and nucleotidyltransferase domain
VRDVMKTEFDLVDGRMTVMEALRTMSHVETKTLIVNKRDENDEYGMVLISDIATRVLAKDRSPYRVNVYEIMSKPLLPVDPIWIFVIAHVISNASTCHVRLSLSIAR